MSNTNQIELTDMLRELRVQLFQAWNDGMGEPMKFELADVELELRIATSREKEGKGGIKFWVCNAEASASTSEVTTQQIKLKLRPILALSDGNSPVYVNDETSLPR